MSTPSDATPAHRATALETPWLDAGDDGITMSFADFIERLGAGFERFDEHFARRLAATLHARAGHIRFPAVDRFELSDVVVTLYMDRKLRLVVTGHHDETLAEVTLRWADRDFDSVGMRLSRTPEPSPYTFATLDFSVRDRRATMRETVGAATTGTEVALRCLATIGDDVHYRVQCGGQEIAVQPDQLELHAE